MDRPFGVLAAGARPMSMGGFAKVGPRHDQAAGGDKPGSNPSKGLKQRRQRVEASKALKQSLGSPQF
jgi:hypothetical protein